VTWAPDYVTAEQLKSYLRIGDNADDAFIAAWITTVSRNVDDFTGRQFGQTLAESRYYTPVWDRAECAWFAEIDDVQDVTGLTVTDSDGTAVPALTSTVAGYQLLPRNAAAKGRPYERLKLTVATGEIDVNVKFGWSAVPSAVPTGALLQAARLNHRRSSPFGIAGSPTEGTQVRLLAQLDPDFRTSLKPYVRDWWAA
jgi:uncharacterized phiE125 gp8 family phage protein